MVKILLRILAILLVAGLVAGSVYLFVEKGGASALGIGMGTPRDGAPFGMEGGRDFSARTLGASPDGPGFGGGEQAFPGGDFRRGDRVHNGEMRFSINGLSGVAAQAGKIALITVLVVGVQAIFRLLKRSRRRASAAVPGA